MAPLLWIVKTADSRSLSHSEKQEQLRVFSHAQRTSRRQKVPRIRRPARTQQPSETQQTESGMKPDLRMMSAPRMKPLSETRDPDQSSRALEFYLSVLAPHGAWSSSNTYCGKCSSDDFKHYMVQMVIAEPLLLEASLAFSMAHLDGCCCCQEHNDGTLVRGPSAGVLQHRGKILSILLTRINAAAVVMDDATLFAILLIVVLDSTISDWEAHTTHLAGLDELLARRGGIASLQYGCYFRTVMTWAHLRAATRTAAQRRISSSTLPTPEYPTLPYPPDLCFKISRQPIGFTEAALSSGLSMQVINFLVSACAWMEQFDPQAEECRQSREFYKNGLILISALTGILVNFSLKPRERILCIGVYAYVISADARQNTHRQPRGLEVLLVGIEELLGENEPLDLEQLWAAMAIASNTDTISWTSGGRWFLLDRYVDQPHALHCWMDVLQILKRFFWNPALEERWHTCWKTALERKEVRQTFRRLSV